MALLDGFEVISLKEKIEDVYLTITAKSLKFSCSNARALELPEHIRILFHEENRQIAIIPARETDENSIRFTFAESKREQPIQVKEPAVLKAVSKMAALERDGQNLSLKIKGTIYPKDRAIVYDLKDAAETILKPRGRAARKELPDSE